MRALVQRVSSASVSVEGERIAAIGSGLLVLLGVHADDGPDEAERIARKLLALRVFEDDDGQMNLSAADAGGAFLVRLALHALRRREPRQPAELHQAAAPQSAEPLYEQVRSALSAEGGSFGASMEVELVNDGPVTLLVEA